MKSIARFLLVNVLVLGLTVGVISNLLSKDFEEPWARLKAQIISIYAGIYASGSTEQAAPFGSGPRTSAQCLELASEQERISCLWNQRTQDFLQNCQDPGFGVFSDPPSSWCLETAELRSKVEEDPTNAELREQLRQREEYYKQRRY
jgi:hypothetical protein